MSNAPIQRPVQPSDLFQLHFLHSVALSPDGAQVAYSVATHDADDDADYEQLWLLETASGAARQLTFGKQRNHSPQWSPDGKTVAFLSTRSGKAQIHLLPVDGGEARQLTNFKQGISGGPVWSPDGRQVAFSAGPQPDQPHDPTLPYRLTRHVYRFDAIGYLDPAVQDIYVIDAAGGEARRLTTDDCNNTAPQWSPDGSRLLFLATMQPDLHQAIFPALRVVTLDGAATTVVAPVWGSLSGGAAWLPDSRQIAFIGVEAGQTIGTQNDLFVVDTASKSVTKRTAGLDRQVGARLQADMPAGVTAQMGKVIVADEGKTAYVQVQIGGAVHLYQVGLSGAAAYAAVASGDRSCFLLDCHQPTTTLLYAVSDFTTPPDLYLADGAGQNERRLTHLNDAFLAGLQAAAVEHLWFPGQDGVPVEGWLIRPTVGPRIGSAPYPTILYIHGGPHSAFGAVYHFDTQLLVGAGYAVLMVNHRASTGYGNAFATAIKGDWGNLDYTDLMAGVDAVIAQGWADPERLGVCGLSGGGNLSCWIVGQTDRFKAAVPENPVTNWQSFYGVSDIGVWFAVEQLGGHPHEIPATYVRCSPITYAHRCKTPTLLVQGEHDWRCPAEQAEQFYTVLKVNGCPVEMVRLPAMPHAGAINGPPKMRRAQNEALLGWMKRYVKLG